MGEGLSKRILVVDDDKNMRFFCSEVLSAAGYVVDMAYDGLDGLESLKAAEYDLVITDINMPRLDGMDFYRKAVEDKPMMKEAFLFMTAGIFSIDTSDLIKESDRKCLHKPFKITELLAHVDDAISRAAGTAVKGKGDEKRAADRLPLNSVCELFLKDVRNHGGLSATAVDISRNGLKVSYEGDALEPGSDLGVYARINGNDLLRGATVVWSKCGSGGMNLSGLCFPTPLPVLSIIGSIGAIRGAAALSERLAS